MHVLVDSLKSVVLALHVHVSNVSARCNRYQYTVTYFHRRAQHCIKVHKLVLLVVHNRSRGLLLQELVRLVPL